MGKAAGDGIKRKNGKTPEGKKDRTNKGAHFAYTYVSLLIRPKFFHHGLNVHVHGPSCCSTSHDIGKAHYCYYACGVHGG